MTRAFADTNWLVALYFQQPTRTRLLRSWSRRYRPQLLTSAPVLLEARNVFARLSGQTSGPEWRVLLEALGGGLVAIPHTWPEVVTQAEELTDRYGHKTAISTADFLGIASALLSGASWFLSFDQNSGARALASVLKLAVFPELAIQDKRIAAELKR